MHDDEPRRHSPAAERNGPHLLEALRQRLPAHGTLLEVATGTGQHAACLGAGLPGWTWWPTDADPDALPSIRAWCDGLALHERVAMPANNRLLVRARVPAVG